MPKEKPHKFNNSKSKKTDNITVRFMKPFYSSEVKRWLRSKSNAPHYDAFDDAIHVLNEDENRISKTKSDGYDHWYKACHKHFTKTLAVFYEYINTQLHILAVMKHFNDSTTPSTVQIRCSIYHCYTTRDEQTDKSFSPNTIFIIIIILSHI